MDWLSIQIAGRTLLRRRGFCVTSIAVLGLGIGGFALVFSVVSRALLRPISSPAADRLVTVHQVFPDLRARMPNQWDSFGLSFEAFRALQEGVPAYDVVAAMATGSRVLSTSSEVPPERIDVLRVSSTAFDLLGVHPVRGRAILRGEDAPPGARLAIISFDFWQRRFGGAEGVIERTLVLDGIPHQIIGVMPRGFQLPRANTPGVWIPIGSDADDSLPRKTPLTVIARLRTGANDMLAAEQTARVFNEIDVGQKRSARVTPWQVELTRSIRRPLQLLLVGSFLLLAMAGVSVAGQFAIDLRSRLREFATKAALGASRARILGQLSLEATLLGVAAAGVGLSFAVLMLSVLRRVAVPGLPQLQVARVDGFVAGVSAGLAVGTFLVIGLVSGLIVVGRAPATWLATGGRSKRRPAFAKVSDLIIVGTQFALATVLLVGATLLTANVVMISRVNPGFDPRGRAVLQLEIGRQSADAESAIPLMSDIATRLRQLPGIRQVAVASAIPFSGGNSSGAMTVERNQVTDTINARFSSVIPGYFAVLGLLVVAGRAIGDDDRLGTEQVAVINETMARTYWPSGDALGARIGVGASTYSIVGVVSDVRHTSLIDPALPTAYFPEAQRHSRFLQFLLQVDCGGVSARRCEELTGLSAIRKVVSEVATNAVVTRLDLLPGLVSRTYAAERFRTGLTLTFAMVAVALTIVGAYGTTVRAIQLARTEIAIRAALGAPNAAIVRMFTARLGVSALIGALAGVGGTLAGQRWLNPFLTLVSATNPVVPVGVAAALTIVAVATAALAARAVARINPGSVLKGA